MDESLVFGESTVENTTGATNENSTGAASEELTDAVPEGDAYAESDRCSSVFVGNSLYVFFRYYEVLASPST